ncbi:MAG: hypothetical protein FP816_04835 [Desulfobacteraceae bacterium]|nr:hypothetical protein [Desulfobacteraceae bacterium]
MKKKLGFVLALLLLVPSIALAVDVGGIKLGGEVQMRGYELNNFWSFYDDSNKSYPYATAADFSDYYRVDDDWSVFRIKTALNVSADLGDNVFGYIRISNQTYGENIENTEYKGQRDGDNIDNKVFVENAFIDVKNIASVPFSLRIGRQNLMYGSGFVLFDGQSQFASTSMYFDGIKGTYNFTDTIMLDAFYVIDQENNRANNSASDGGGDDIYLMGLYLTASDWSPIGGKQEVYAMQRKDQSLDMDIKMFGVRFSDKFDMGLDYSLEGAKQLGQSAWSYAGDYDQDAWGGKADLGYTFTAVEAKPRIFTQYAYMSGDDPETDDFEGWNVFYGGWPQFGDLLAWKFVNVPWNNNANYDYYWAAGTTPGEAAYSNLRIATVGASCVAGPVAPSVSYSKINLDQTYGYGYDSDDFGDYYQANVSYQYNKALSFAAYYAVLMPGDAFWGTDDAYEFYWEAKLKF